MIQSKTLAASHWCHLIIQALQIHSNKMASLNTEFESKHWSKQKKQRNKCCNSTKTSIKNKERNIEQSDHMYKAIN